MGQGGNDQIGQPTTEGRAARRARCRQSSRRATTRREGQALEQHQQKLGGDKVAHRSMLPLNYRLPQMSYDDIRQIMNRRELQQKKGLMTDNEIEKLVGKWRDDREKDIKEDNKVDKNTHLKT